MRQTFALGEALSAISGRLLCDMEGVYRVLNFLTQDNLFTHQLPRAFKECEPVLKERYPELAALPFDEITPDNYKEWLARQVDRFGPTVELEAIPPQNHVEIDPILEAERMVGSNRIIAVAV